MIVTDPTKDLTAIGQLAHELSVLTDSVKDTAAALGIEPAMRINRVMYFSREQVERIAAALKSGAIASHRTRVPHIT